MRRSERRALINLSLFAGALCILLYLNLPHPWQHKPKAFSWTTVRYETITNRVPEAHGHCAGLSENSSPALVVASAGHENITWQRQLDTRYVRCPYGTVYEASHPSDVLQLPANRGHEAMAYLTFIIDNYKNIPAAGAVFVHGSRFAWHNDSPNYDNLALLTALNVSAALAPSGYHNLRCDWSASTCSPEYGPPQGSLETNMKAKVQPWDLRAVSDAALTSALKTLFGESGPPLGRHQALRAQCCAQFAVSRERIWQHSQDEYVALRQWLLDGTAPSDDRVSGRILSYAWHILFLGPSATDAQGGIDLEKLNDLACPHAGDCYCRLYSRCHLEGCLSPDSCYGQYALPPDFTLPKDWEASHS